MIEYGRSIRWFNDYKEEVDFSKSNEFDFMQVWFMDGELMLDKAVSPKEECILSSGFPMIIHVFYDINDYDKYNGELLRILKYLNHKEVIIHPVCNAIPENPENIYMLSDKIYETNQLLKAGGVKLYVEHNAAGKIFYTADDLKILFDRNPDAELLLDTAHIDDYDHLQRILEIKFPKCLHISDKHFSVGHEHLAVGQGDLDFEMIFKNYLKGYDGKIIFEIVGSDEEIIQSKNMIREILQSR